MRYVWDRRLTRCDREVTDPAMRGRRVRQIAFAADFNDLSHFSRAYRARYGCTPRCARSALRPSPLRHSSCFTAGSLLPLVLKTNELRFLYPQSTA